MSIPDASDRSDRRPSRYLLLLVSLSLLLVCVPILEGTTAGQVMHYSFFTVVFVCSLYANRERRRVFVAGLVVAAVAIPLTWSTLVFRDTEVSLARYLVAILFLGTTAAMILVSITRDHLATRDAVLGSVCVYLLMGITWALAYAAIDQIEETPFDVAHRHTVGRSEDGKLLTAYSQFVYFSFVTMSTLGYGDITPRTPSAQTLTWIQAVTGQFYLAILVARLVGILPTPRDESSERARIK